MLVELDVCSQRVSIESDWRVTLDPREGFQAMRGNYATSPSIVNLDGSRVTVKKSQRIFTGHTVGNRR